MPDCYNLQDLTRKNLLYIDKSCWWTDELHYIDAGWVYHFNAIPQNNMNRDVSYWMERTYTENCMCSILYSQTKRLKISMM